MFRKACLVAILCLVACPVFGAGGVLVHGGLAAQSISVSVLGFFGRQPVLIPSVGWRLDDLLHSTVR